MLSEKEIEEIEAKLSAAAGSKETWDFSEDASRLIADRKSLAAQLRAHKNETLAMMDHHKHNLRVQSNEMGRLREEIKTLQDQAELEALQDLYPDPCPYCHNGESYHGENSKTCDECGGTGESLSPAEKENRTLREALNRIERLASKESSHDAYAEIARKALNRQN